MAQLSYGLSGNAYDNSPLSYGLGSAPIQLSYNAPTPSRPSLSYGGIGSGTQINPASGMPMNAGTNLSFGGLTNATTQGNQLTTQQTGLSQIASQYAPMDSYGSGLNVADVSVGNPMQGITQPNINNNPMGAGQGGFFRNTDGSWNTGNMQLLLGGIQVLGNLWSTYQQHKIAKEQLSLARETFDTNVRNQTQTYNTALEDRIRSRHFTEGRPAEDTDRYLSEHRL